MTGPHGSAGRPHGGARPRESRAEEREARRRRSDATLLLPDDQAIGAGRIGTYVLALWPTDTISRADLCAVVGHARPDVVGISSKVRCALKTLRNDGLVTFTPDTVTIIDRDALLDRAHDNVDSTHPRFGDARAALTGFRDRQTRAAADAAREEWAAGVEARERELRQIIDLAAGPYGRAGLPSNGHATRVVGAGKAGR